MVLINKKLNLILLLSVFFLNILAMTPFLQDDNEESDVFFPALLQGFGLKNQKRESDRQVLQGLPHPEADEKGVLGAPGDQHAVLWRRVFDRA